MLWLIPSLYHRVRAWYQCGVCLCVCVCVCVYSNASYREQAGWCLRVRQEAIVNEQIVITYRGTIAEANLTHTHTHTQTHTQDKSMYRQTCLPHTNAAPLHPLHRHKHTYHSKQLFKGASCMTSEPIVCVCMCVCALTSSLAARSLPAISVIDCMCVHTQAQLSTHRR